MKTRIAATFEDRMQSEAARVVEILDHWDAKMSGHHSEKRAFPRVRMNGVVRLFEPKHKGMSRTVRDGLAVFARNISPQGFGFIYKGRIHAEQVVLCLDPEGRAATWFAGKIVRSRQVHHDFWEYGVQFTERATPEEALAHAADDRADL